MTEKLILMHENTTYFIISPFMKPLGGSRSPSPRGATPAYSMCKSELTPSFRHHQSCHQDLPFLLVKHFNFRPEVGKGFFFSFFFFFSNFLPSPLKPNGP